jgi:hypothetical protein
MIVIDFIKIHQRIVEDGENKVYFLKTYIIFSKI